MAARVSDSFAIVTLADARNPIPAWHQRLHWPVAGDAHVALDLHRQERRSLWAGQIDNAVLHADRTVLFVAEGAACLVASWWARLSPAHYVSRVGGALLLDPDADDRHGAFAAPPTPLPFPSVVLTAAGAGQDVSTTIASWGSRSMVGNRTRRHDVPAWQGARRLIIRLTGAVVAHEVARGIALRGGAG